jgi:predicted AAA+ superfamily ATPase
MYQREILPEILKWMAKKEVITIYGARQVGKTTLLECMLKDLPNSLIIPCDRPAAEEVLEDINLGQIRQLFGANKIIALDEAQNIKNIGRVLKIIYDDKSFDYKIIATGSSSFDLANKISEPLTGRNVKFKLLPLSINEIQSKKDWLWIKENIEQLMIFGSYPEIIDLNYDERITKLEHLASDYLFKDILAYERINNPDVLRKLLKALALQIGQMVSISELSNLVRLSSPTVEKYLDLLEKTFVIFSLPTYSSNLRNEIKKSKKYYFWDLGIRNALIQNYGALSNRQDVGGLWENYCIVEKIKFNNNHQKHRSTYYWRTYDGAEIDLIEVENEKISAFEFKWNPNKTARLPRSFAEKYDVQKFITINPKNFNELLQ